MDTHHTHQQQPSTTHASNSFYGFTQPIVATPQHDPALDDILLFFSFAHKLDDSWSGVIRFDLKYSGHNDEIVQKTVQVMPPHAAPTSATPTHLSPRVKVYSNSSSQAHHSPPPPKPTAIMHMTRDTFFDVYSGALGPLRSLMDGHVRVENWRYREVKQFANAFDMSRQKWEEFYKLGINENVPAGGTAQPTSILPPLPAFTAHGFLPPLSACHAIFAHQHRRSFPSFSLSRCLASFNLHPFILPSYLRMDSSAPSLPTHVVGVPQHIHLTSPFRLTSYSYQQDVWHLANQYRDHRLGLDNIPDAYRTHDTTSISLPAFIHKFVPSLYFLHPAITRRMAGRCREMMMLVGEL